MSIHKKDIESLLEAFTAVHSKGNMKASGELIPHLVRSLVNYIGERLGDKPECCEKTDPCCEGKLSGEDKAFAEAAIVTSLKDNGNATIETDKGNLSVTVDKGLSQATGLEIEREVAQAIVAEIENEGATEITAVTTQTDETTTEKPARKAPAKK